MPSTSERAPDPRPARTRAAIFAAARDLSVSDGEVNVNALAKRAGVSRAAFYSHFAGLDDLMAAMIQEMFEAAHERGDAYVRRGGTLHESVRLGYGALAVYMERHHAFLRGSLDWKISHRVYLGLQSMLAAQHQFALERLGDEVPPALRGQATARSLTGASLALVENWLLETEEEAADGTTPDVAGLLEALLVNAPTWYTGLDPAGTVPVAEVLEIVRAGADE